MQMNRVQQWLSTPSCPQIALGMLQVHILFIYICIHIYINFQVYMHMYVIFIRHWYQCFMNMTKVSFKCVPLLMNYSHICIERMGWKGGAYVYLTMLLWVIYMCHESFMCVTCMSRLYVSGVIYVCHESFMCVMSHLYVVRGPGMCTVANVASDSIRRCDVWQGSCPCCNTLQHTATHCNTLQHTATRCTALPRRCLGNSKIAIWVYFTFIVPLPS